MTVAARASVTLALIATSATVITLHHTHKPSAAPSNATTLAEPVPPRVSRWLERKPLPRPTHKPVARPHLTVVPPLNWHGLALCESTDNPHAADPSQTYFGLYQFDILTWRSVGGRGNPADASRAEQTFRARILFGMRGRTPWPVCGVHL